MGKFESSIYSDFLVNASVESTVVSFSNYWKYLKPGTFYPQKFGTLYLKQRPQGFAIFFLDARNNLDLLDFWNLRAAGWRLVPVARQSAENTDLIDYCSEFINEYLDGDTRRDFRIIKSRSVSQEEVQTFQEKVAAVSKEPRNVGVQAWYPRMWDEWARENAGEGVEPVFSRKSSVDISSENTEISFRSLDPEFELFGYTGTPLFALQIDSRVYGSKELLAEVIPKGGERVSRAIGGYGLREWRIGNTGPIYLSHQNQRSIRYKLPTSEEIVVAWLAEKGWKVELSSSGKIAKQMLKQLGGLFGVNQLKREKLMLLLQEASNGVITEKKLSARVAEIVNTERYFRTRDHFIKGLLEQQILELGVELKCPVCSQRSWYSLADLQGDTKCLSCLADNRVQSLELNAKQWAYRSTGTFGLPRQAYGAYGVLLTLSFFQQGLGDRITSLLSFNANSGTKEIEADLAVFIDKGIRGKSQPELLFAECKSYNKFERKDVDRMSHLASEFPGASLVFSTLRRKLTVTEKRLLRPLANRGRRYWKSERMHNPVIIITGNELFSFDNVPFCWRDVAGRAGELEKEGFFPRTLGMLADATQQVYLDMKPYLESGL